MLKVAAILFVACLAIVLGYPCAATVAHGLNPAAWPAAVLSPDQWLRGYLPAVVCCRCWPFAPFRLRLC
jgi:hypothetical protein